MISELSGAGLARGPACAAQRLGGAMAGKRRKDDRHRGVRIGPPARVHGKWTSTRTRAQPVAGRGVVDDEPRSCSSLVGRPAAASEQRAVSHADRRQVEHGPEVKGEAGTSWMVAARAVYEQRVGHPDERAYCSFERSALAERQQAGSVRSSSLGVNHGGGVSSCRCGPQGVAGGARTGFPARRADEAAADHGVVEEAPRRWLRLGECALDVDELLGRDRPRRHAGRILPVPNGLSQADLLAVLRSEGIGERLLDAVEAVPRREFVPTAVADRAYEDAPLRIPHGQVTTQPSLVARMVEALALGGTERVLEVGTGFGWQTALLARLAREVWSVERWPDLAEEARVNLGRRGVENATVVVGDGSGGLPDRAPFEAIIVSAAFPEVPEPLATQLADGGFLVQPIGPGGREDVVLFQRRPDGLVPRWTITGAHFVPLVGRWGFPA